MAPVRELVRQAAHSIETFEEVGTVFKVMPSSIPEAIAFNCGIGQAEKSARLRYRRNRWAVRLREHVPIRLLTDIDADPAPASAASLSTGWTARRSRLRHGWGPDIARRPSAAGPEQPVEEVDRFVEAAFAILARSHNAFMRAE